MLIKLGHGILLASLLGLTACSNMRPLYGTAANGSSVAADISSLSVEEQRNRAGQIVRNELLDGVRPGQARFVMKLQVSEQTLSVASFSSHPGARMRYALNAHYELVDGLKGGVVARGDSFSNVEFDTINVPVSDLQAADDARRRAAKELGQDLRLRIAAQLSAAKG